MSKTCPKCKQTKELDRFGFTKTTNKHNSWCKDCTNIKNREYRKKYPERAKEQRIRHRTKHPDRIKSSDLKYEYGITLEEYNALCSQQNNACKICNNACRPGRPLSVDHCHKTNKVRGLLCAKCNQGLGLFDDNVDKLIAAASYLRSTSET